VKLRIALAHKRLDLKGGTERDLYRTAEGLRDLGHEIHLFCSEFGVAPPSGTFAHGIPVVPFGRTARLWSFALLAPANIKKYRCDLVISFGRMLEADIVRSGGGTHRGFLERLGRAGGMRRVWQQASPYHRSVLAVEKRQFAPGRFTRIIAVSNEVKRDIIANYAVPDERIAVLYNGVDHERFHPSLRAKWRAPMRKEWGIPDQAPVVLFVGSGFRRKGLDRLLAIWGSSGLHDAYLIVVGEDARPGNYKARAKAIANGRIIFAGRHESVEKFYGAADIVALPSLQEAFGNVVLEALACGLPALVTAGVGAAEVLSGGLTDGVVRRPDDPMELEQKIVALLGRSHETSCAREARNVGEAYSWKNHFSKLEALLKAVRAAKQGERVS
jgi:UDP-glucose:(heptosyl)LPS alpha-1,3-glucosyltransferase